MPDLPPYFIQSLSGRDHAQGDPAATQMVNLSYLVGDPETGECVVVDPSWDPLGLVARAEADGLRVVGAVVTHYHADHAGGSLMGYPVPGVKELVAAGHGPVHVHRDDEAMLQRRSGLDERHLVLHDEGDTIQVGAVALRLLHTPGHSPGSICLVAHQALLAGDTLFIQGCGRVDLPGSDPRAMARSLARLAELPGELEVFPGHDYSGLRAPLAEVKVRNPVFRMF